MKVLLRKMKHSGNSFYEVYRHVLSLNVKLFFIHVLGKARSLSINNWQTELNLSICLRNACLSMQEMFSRPCGWLLAERVSIPHIVAENWLFPWSQSYFIFATEILNIFIKLESFKRRMQSTNSLSCR